jgi:predicted nucleic acid-binding protein
MKVLADTSVWSLALRRREQNYFADKLADLILESMVVLIGPVRQELLSGVSSDEAYLILKSELECFDDLPLTTADYETAAWFSNVCRLNGAHGSHIDFLICAVAANHNLLIFSIDQSFNLLSKHLPVRMFQL